MLSFVILGLVSSASACCIPDQWSANIGLQYAVWNDATVNGTFAEGSIEIFYDAKAKIMAQNQMLYIMNQYVVKQRLVMDYNQGITFMINENGTCTKHMLGQWESNCLPANATTGESVIYGLGASTVNTNYYNFKYGNSDLYMMVTADTCVPVVEDVVTKVGPVTTVQFMGYNNVKAGQLKPNDFFVPVTCTPSLPILPPIPGTEGVAARSITRSIVMPQ